MEHTPLPQDVVYVPPVEELEVLPEAAEICKKGFGGSPIQIGYCNVDKDQEYRIKRISVIFSTPRLVRAEAGRLVYAEYGRAERAS